MPTFSLELELLDFAVENFGTVKPRKQTGPATNPYRRRTPEDSGIGLDDSFPVFFDLLRILDPVRYPAFFEFRGHRYD